MQLRFSKILYHLKKKSSHFTLPHFHLLSSLVVSELLLVPLLP